MLTIYSLPGSLFLPHLPLVETMLHTDKHLQVHERPGLNPTYTLIRHQLERFEGRLKSDVGVTTNTQ